MSGRLPRRLLLGILIGSKPTPTPTAAPWQGVLRRAGDGAPNAILRVQSCAVDGGHSAEGLEPMLAAGPFQRYLPEECRRRVVEELIDVPAFRRWLRTRRVWEMTRNDPRWTLVEAALRAGT